MLRFEGVRQMRAYFSKFWWGPVVGLLAAFAASSAPSASAQQEAPSNLTVIGKFYNPEGTRALFVVTTKPAKGESKTAGVGVQFENYAENYRFNGTYGKLVAAFVDADDWRKFAAIWKKARSGQDSRDNEYFDGQTMIMIGPNHDGSVSLTFAGNGHDERNVPKDLSIFDLPAKDLPEFDREVKQVSDYFAK